MTVRELIAALQACDPDYLVVMSRDSEGNGFSPVAETAGENNSYIPDTEWSGEIRIHHLTDELREHGYTDEDVDAEGQRAVVLWPTN